MPRKVKPKTPKESERNKPRTAGERRGGQNIEKNRELAKQIGKEGFKNPREQYIYTKREIPSHVLCEIWGVTRRAIEQQKTRATKAGNSWQDARHEYLKQLSDGVTKVVRQQAEEDAADVTSNLQSIAGALLVKVSSMIPNAAKPSEIAALVRAFKTMVDTYNDLTGVNAQREVYRGRREENDYFEEMVKQYVSNPEDARSLGYAIKHRKGLIGFGARSAFRDHIDGVYRAGHRVSEAEQAVIDIDPKD